MSKNELRQRVPQVKFSGKKREFFLQNCFLTYGATQYIIKFELDTNYKFKI